MVDLAVIAGTGLDFVPLDSDTATDADGRGTVAVGTTLVCDVFGPFVVDSFLLPFFDAFFFPEPKKLYD
jgi:hypothetical protein